MGKILAVLGIVVQGILIRVFWTFLSRDPRQKRHPKRWFIGYSIAYALLMMVTLVLLVTTVVVGWLILTKGPAPWEVWFGLVLLVFASLVAGIYLFSRTLFLLVLIRNRAWR